MGHEQTSNGTAWLRPRLQSEELLSANLDHSRRFPRAVQDRRRSFRWIIHPQHRQEVALRSRQPIRFLVRARRLVLEVERQRTVGVWLRVVARADSELVQRV